VQDVSNYTPEWLAIVGLVAATGRTNGDHLKLL
jgi:hypothetical protein